MSHLLHFILKWSQRNQDHTHWKAMGPASRVHLVGDCSFNFRKSCLAWLWYCWRSRPDWKKTALFKNFPHIKNHKVVRSIRSWGYHVNRALHLEVNNIHFNKQTKNPECGTFVRQNTRFLQTINWKLVKGERNW